MTLPHSHRWRNVPLWSEVDGNGLPMKDTSKTGREARHVTIAYPLLPYIIDALPKQHRISAIVKCESTGLPIGIVISQNCGALVCLAILGTGTAEPMASRRRRRRGKHQSSAPPCDPHQHPDDIALRSQNRDENPRRGRASRCRSQ